MTIAWRFACDGAGCKAVEVCEQFAQCPVGWLLRTITDRVERIESHATGSGLPGGCSESQCMRHYCAVCRRKLERV